MLKQIGGPTGNIISARRSAGALTVKTEEKKPTAMNPMPNLLRRAALPAVASLLLAAAAADTTGNLQKTFTVTPGGTIVIEADRGAIEVTTGGDSQVSVQVDRKVTRASEAKATELLASHTVTFQQDGNRVTVKAKLPAASSARWFGPNLQVHYQVVVPKNFNLDLKTAGGSITVADLTGQVKAHTAGGSIKTGHTEGTVQVTTAGGSITIEAATGAIEARTAGGSVHVGEAGGTLLAETSGGSIHTTKTMGKARLSTAGGSIEAFEIHAPIEATTSGGSITASLAGTPEGDCRFETSAGSVTLSVPAGLSADVDARTSAGRVIADLPVTVQGEARPSQLMGKLGAGGKQIKLRTSAGNIHLKSL